MRSTIFFFALLFAGSLSAQNYTQNAPPVQQTKAADDCYTRMLDNGNAALRRGETNEALRFFKEAKNCPDAQGSLRRQSELDTRIARCEEQVGIKTVSTESTKKDQQPASVIRKRTFSNEVPSVRRNYPTNPGFLKDTLDKCYYHMVAEADKAYRQKYWEDAQALYRAAKNCADADQKGRQQMSEKIALCRKAAEYELFSKQQEAERQARNAIAANLADEAQDLLRSTDRSLAFRLADFANQYIAPEDNPACVQAMFDAWYYQPEEHRKHRADEVYRPVFCYELEKNLGENVQIKFEEQPGGTQWLWAFVPKNGDLFTWEMPSMKMVQSYGVGDDTGYKGFDLSPARDLLFWGDNFFELRRGTRTHRIPVRSVANWCFDGRGNEFFYEDKADQKIYVLNVREAFAQQMTRKNSKKENILQLPVVARAMVSGIPDGLLAMQYLDGKFWLGFSDRVEILSKPEAGKSWNRQTISFEGVVLPEIVSKTDLRLALYPKEGFAVLGCFNRTWSIPIGLKSDTSILKEKTRVFENMLPLAISPAKHQVACEYLAGYLNPGFWVMDAYTGDTLLRQVVPSYTAWGVFNGSFSLDGRWVAATNSNGDISIWALKDAPTVWTTQIPHTPEGKPTFSPNGEHLFIATGDTLSILNTSESHHSEHSWKGLGLPLRGASDHWALIQVSPDSAEARHLGNGKTLRFPLSEGFQFLYAFDSKGENLVAYLSDWNKVEVRSMKTGSLVASREFIGGNVGELHFLPGTDDLLVVLHTAMGESEIGQSSVKIWSPLQTAEKPRALRLDDYPVYAMTIEGSGERAAFSNGSDIRIFELGNIENEAIKIRTTKGKIIKSIAFRPNSKQIAAAYTNGEVIFWNSETGQAELHLQAFKQSTDMWAEIIPVIGFTRQGTILNLATTDGRLISYALDPSHIRSVAQDENRQLQAFGVEHIVQYELESALYYPGNFERLADSEDKPLLRAFFQHFELQATESNNITQVQEYCKRALYLYERLGGFTQEIWRENINRMYENYAWKLLLRGNIKEAASESAFIQQKFGHYPLLLNAHIALLRRDCAEASALYSKYFLTEGEAIPATYETDWKFEQAERELAQLRDYLLIDSFQVDCYCATANSTGLFHNFCQLHKKVSSNFLSVQDRSRWEIYQKREAANHTSRIDKKVEYLDEALQKAKSLVKIKPSEGAVWEETVLFELASATLKWAIFEGPSPNAMSHYEKAAQLLTNYGAFKKLPDTSRLSLLTSTHLAWGKQHLNAGKTAEAIYHFNQGQQAISKLAVLVAASDTVQLKSYYENLAGPLYEKTGTAFLLEGKPVEARQAYEQSNVYYMTNGLNSLYLGNVAVFENDTIQAFLDYAGIFDPSQTAAALFEIERLAEKFPEHRARLKAFGPRLRNALGSKSALLTNSEADFWLAYSKTESYVAQAKWDSAIAWQRMVLQNAKRCMEIPNKQVYWTEAWLDAHINLSYYLLLGAWNKPKALDECIQFAEKAEAFVASQNTQSFYYRNRELLKSNHAMALVLRNQAGDREKAIELYKQYLESYADSRGYDNWELLEKDIRDLKNNGAPWPDLPELNPTMNDER